MDGTSVAALSEIWRQGWPASTYAGKVAYPPGGQYGPRVQPHVQLVALHSGSLTLHVGEERRVYEAGTLLWLLPGQRLFFEFARDKETWHSWVDYRGEPPGQVLQFLQRVPLSLPMTDSVERLLQEAVSWQFSERPSSAELVRTAAYQILLMYLDEASGSGVGDGACHPLVLKVIRYATAHLGRPLRLADLAAHASVSPEHLCRLFAQAGYPSPMAWLWEVRTRRSLAMLRSTGLRVEEVASQCGFRSPYHFSRRVKALTGRSPTQYRRDH